MIGDAGRYQPADQVARDIAGDVAGERAAGVHRAALFAEIGKRQREGRRHAEPLHDPQDREGGEIRRHREQRGRDRRARTRLTRIPSRRSMRRLNKATTSPATAMPMRAGVDGKAHRGRRHPIVLRQRRQDRLRGEQIDDGEECRQADDQRPAQNMERAAMRVHVRQIHGGRHLRHGQPLLRRLQHFGRFGSCRMTPSSGSKSSSQGA